MDFFARISEHSITVIFMMCDFEDHVSFSQCSKLLKDNSGVGQCSRNIRPQFQKVVALNPRSKGSFLSRRYPQRMEDMLGGVRDTVLFDFQSYAQRFSVLPSFRGGLCVSRSAGQLGFMAVAAGKVRNPYSGGVTIPHPLLTHVLVEVEVDDSIEHMMLGLYGLCIRPGVPVSLQFVGPYRLKCTDTPPCIVGVSGDAPPGMPAVLGRLQLDAAYVSGVFDLISFRYWVTGFANMHVPLIFVQRGGWICLMRNDLLGGRGFSTSLTAEVRHRWGAVFDDYLVVEPHGCDCHFVHSSHVSCVDLPFWVDSGERRINKARDVRLMWGRHSHPFADPAADFEDLILKLPLKITLLLTVVLCVMFIFVWMFDAPAWIFILNLFIFPIALLVSRVNCRSGLRAVCCTRL